MAMKYDSERTKICTQVQYATGEVKKKSIFSKIAISLSFWFFNKKFAQKHSLLHVRCKTCNKEFIAVELVIMCNYI